MSNALALKDAYRQKLELGKNHYANMLAGSIDTTKFTEVALTAILNTYNIGRCEQSEVLKAVTKAAKANLLPDGDEACFVVRNNKHGSPSCAFQPMIKGVLKTLHRSNQIKTIIAEVVYNGEPFKCWIDGEKGKCLEHEPDYLEERTVRIDKNIRCVYAIVTTVNGGKYIEVMNTKDIDKIKAKAQTQKFWGPYYVDMAKKTVLHKVSKKLPLDAKMEVVQKAMDEEYNTIETTATVVEEKKSLPTESKRIENLVESQEKPKKSLVI